MNARRRRRSLRTRTVVVLALGVGALLAAVVFGHRAYWRRHVQLTFVGDGTPTPTQLTLTFFPDRLAFAQLSPPPALGEMTWSGGALTLGADLVPGRAVVRYAGPGVGSGCVHVQLGANVPPVRMRAPRTLRGRVGLPIPTWCEGWRCAGLWPLADAEVQLMAGGEHGIELARARTDRRGAFTIEGADRTRGALAVRVRAAGCAIAHHAVPSADDRELELAVPPGARCRGQVEVPPGIDPSTLRVFARGLPGVDAPVGKDGAFVLDHLPRRVRARLLLHGLSATHAQSMARVGDAEVVRIVVGPGAAVRGRVRELLSREPLAGAFVYCGDEGDAVVTDDDGGFELWQLQPGDAPITAQFDVVDARRRRTRLIGSRTVQLTAGVVVDDVELLVTRSP